MAACKSPIVHPAAPPASIPAAARSWPARRRWHTPWNKNKIIHALFVEPPAPYDSSRMDKTQFDRAEIKRILLRPSVLYLTGVCR